MTKVTPTDKRVPKQNIVQGSPALLSKEDLVFTKDGIQSDSLAFSNVSYLRAGFDEDAVGSGGTGPLVVTTPVLPVEVIPIPDVPSLFDIESITYEEYPDPLTGVAKYKAVLKIRNSSTEKNNVTGVDAAIYNPAGSKQYALGSTTASGSTTVSNYVQNVTWHNAISMYNPLSGDIYEPAYIAGTQSYPSDGNGVPKDSVSGPSTNRVKSVWRKTEAEALAAANPNI